MTVFWYVPDGCFILNQFWDTITEMASIYTYRKNWVRWLDCHSGSDGWLDRSHLTEQRVHKWSGVSLLKSIRNPKDADIKSPAMILDLLDL